MRKLVKEAAVGLVRLALLAALGYTVLFTMRPQASQKTPATIAGHSEKCKVCQLPLHGHSGGGSQLGPGIETTGFLQ